MRTIVGDCIEVMRGMDADSVDAVVTDPPYGIRFMGKAWDDGEVLARRRDQLDENAKRRNNPNAPGSNSLAAEAGAYDLRAPAQRKFQEWAEVWAREALRVLKPGGHLLAFGGTRTYHRLVCAIEDAGFEIRDTVQWLYGSGFPKGKNVERGVAVLTCQLPGRHFERTLPPQDKRLEGDHVCPTTPESEPWTGYNVALKPAHEPICLARKPLSESSIARNVLEHSTGALNIDGTRVRDTIAAPVGPDGEIKDLPGGRWPANLLLSHSPECRPTGEVRRVKGQNGGGMKRSGSGNTVYSKQQGHAQVESVGYADPDGTEAVEAWECAEGCPIALLGEPARFFQQFSPEGPGFLYQAKSSRAERNKGLEGMPEKPKVGDSGTDRSARDCLNCGKTYNGSNDHSACSGSVTTRLTAGKQNNHPTVKPIALMRYLCRLICPPGGTILDPFAGSGSTGCAAVLEDFDFIGIEQDPKYVKIARKRIVAALEGLTA